MPIKPHIRILKDGWPEANVDYWAGLFDGGWSTLGPVRRMTLADAIKFYFRVLGRVDDRGRITPQGLSTLQSLIK